MPLSGTRITWDTILLIYPRGPLDLTTCTKSRNNTHYVAPRYFPAISRTSSSYSALVLMYLVPVLPAKRETTFHTRAKQKVIL